MMRLLKTIRQTGFLAAAATARTGGGAGAGDTFMNWKNIDDPAEKARSAALLQFSSPCG